MTYLFCWHMCTAWFVMVLNLDLLWKWCYPNTSMTVKVFVQFYEEPVSSKLVFLFFCSAVCSLLKGPMYSGLCVPTLREQCEKTDAWKEEGMRNEWFFFFVCPREHVCPQSSLRCAVICKPVLYQLIIEINANSSVDFSFLSFLQFLTVILR